MLGDSAAWKVKDLLVKDIRLDMFESWSKWTGMEHYSGTIPYDIRFNIDVVREEESVALDLGEVHEICEPYVNGAETKVGLWAPYGFDTTRFVKNVENHLEIRVTNTLSNDMENIGHKSGLLGPVKIIIENSSYCQTL